MVRGELVKVGYLFGHLICIEGDGHVPHSVCGEQCGESTQRWEVDGHERQQVVQVRQSDDHGHAVLKPAQVHLRGDIKGLKKKGRVEWLWVSIVSALHFVCHAWRKAQDLREQGEKHNNNNTVLRNSSCTPPSKLNIILCAAAVFTIKYYEPQQKIIIFILCGTGKAGPPRCPQRPLFGAPSPVAHSLTSKAHGFRV